MAVMLRRLLTLEEARRKFANNSGRDNDWTVDFARGRYRWDTSGHNNDFLGKPLPVTVSYRFQNATMNDVNASIRWRPDNHSHSLVIADEMLYPDPIPAICEICGEPIETEDELHYANGHVYHADCAETKTICPICGKVIDGREYACNIDGETVAICEDCRNDSTVYCQVCGTLHLGCEGDLCSDCRGNYTQCARCGVWISDNDAMDYNGDSYCESCYHIVSEGEAISGHDYKPDPQFHAIPGGERKLYLGIELEVDSDDKDEEEAADLARAIKDEVNGDSHESIAYCKHDGSLGDGGVELVTQPATLEYIEVNRTIYDKLCDIPRDEGFQSHDVKTCGLHVHVSRNFFDSEGQIKLLYLFERLWPAMVRFSRRTPSQISSWAKRYCNESEMETIKPEDIYHRTGGDRYRALNYCNRSTIEFRLWRGTLNKQTFYATLQLVDNFCRLAKATEIEALQAVTMADIVNYRHYPDLDAYSRLRFGDDIAAGERAQDAKAEEVRDSGETVSETVHIPLYSTPRPVDSHILELAEVCGLIREAIPVRRGCTCRGHSEMAINYAESHGWDTIAVYNDSGNEDYSEGSFVVPLESFREAFGDISIRMPVSMLCLEDDSWNSRQIIPCGPDALYVLGFRSMDEVRAYTDHGTLPAIYAERN